MKSFFQINLVIGMTFLFFTSNAQNSIIAKEIQVTSNEVIDEVFNTYQIFDFNLSELYDLVNSEQIEKNPINFTLGTSLDWVINLSAHDIRSENYLLRIGTPSGIIDQPKNQNITYTGYLEGGNEVSLTIDQNFLYGYIHTPDGKYYLEPAKRFDSTLPNDYIIVYKSTDVNLNTEIKCGVTETRELEAEQALSVRFNQCYIVEIALATDFELFTSPGYGSIANIQNRNIAVFNNVATIYRHEFDDNVEFQIVEQVIYTSNPDPWTNSTDVATLLNDFTTWGNAGNFTNPFDIAELVSGRDFDGTTVGYAWVGSVCTNGRYSIVQDLPTAWENEADASHEIGHNFNAGHDGSGTPFIMAPALNNTSSWSAASRSSISSHISSRVCLSNCTAAPVANFTSSSQLGCIGSNITFKDKSTNGSTRSWAFAGGSPSSSTQQQPVVNYASAGAYNVDITSTGVGSNSLTETNYIQITNPNPASVHCAPSGAAGGVGGISHFSMTGISNTSGTANNYTDFICSKLTELQPNTNYELAVTVGVFGPPHTFEQIRFYIDYNNDGDFTDTGENVTNSSFSWAGGPITVASDGGLQFTTPASPLVTGEILRMRVISNQGGVAGSCSTPTTGETEDYGVFFAGVLPIQLIGFSGKRAKEEIILSWETAQEVNNDFFEIERSINGRDFYTLGKVGSKGNGNAAQLYQLIDNAPISGTNYYRLKQVDYDGSFSYSHLVSIHMDTPQKITLFPNPANEVVSIRSVSAHKVLSIELFNEWGVMVKNINITNGSFNISDLASGLYIVNIKTAQGVTVEKLVIK